MNAHPWMGEPDDLDEQIGLRYQQEDQRERLWAFFEIACQEFAAVEGWPAVFRAAARAMDHQQELVRK